MSARQHGNELVGQSAHLQGVFCGSVTTQGGDFDGCRSFTSLSSAMVNARALSGRLTRPGLQRS